MKKLFIGTSGYQYDDWKGRFYPKDLVQRRWLEYYAENFNTVEINATFYHGFRKSVFQSWEKRTPKNFIFCVKGSRIITHIKQLHDAQESIDYFFNSACGLGKKLQLVLWQFPKSFKAVDGKAQERKKRVGEFVGLLPKNVRHAFEFRDTSWFTKDMFALFKKHNICWVIADSKSYPKVEIATADFMYFRFHGPAGLFSSNYNDEQLKKWSKTIKKYRKTHDIFIYFNNDVRGYAVKNAMKLRELLS